MTSNYDVAVVGAGIIGLAHALAAARRGKRVLVLDRDAQANGASIRNFGFITVTGQQAGDCWRMARRSRDVWDAVAQAAGIPVQHRGLVVAAQRPEAEAVVDAFLATEMGADCRKLTPTQAAEQVPALRAGALLCALWSPHEIRVESRTAIPILAHWLAEAHGVDFRWLTHVRDVAPPRIETSRGRFEAETVIVCPGDEYHSLFPDRIADYPLTRCLLQMLRITPETRQPFGAAVMSDLSLARYGGYADLPGTAPLQTLLDRSQPDHRTNGVHLIVVQSADGSLVVGDSHHYAATPGPFAPAAVADLILNEMDAVLDLGPYHVTERWVGTYASADDRWRLTDKPDDATRVVIVTCGTGASTGFAIGEETITELFG